MTGVMLLLSVIPAASPAYGIEAYDQIWVSALSIDMSMPVGCGLILAIISSIRRVSQKSVCCQ